jgi:hypothetical protein
MRFYIYFYVQGLEKDLETQLSMRNELEVAKKLMETSLIEKQELTTRK